MVSYIRSDLDFILIQIKIAEAHARYVANPSDPLGKPLFGVNGSVPAYNVSWGLRTVDGSLNNLLHPTWGAADQQFLSILDPTYRPVTPGTVDFDGPTGPAPPVSTASNYNPSNNPNNIVMDPSLRTISNLIVDQTLDNTAAIMVALQRAGVETSTEQLTIAATIKAEYQTVKPFLEAAEGANLANAAAQRTLAAAEQAFNEDPTPENQAALDAAQAAATAALADADAANAALAAERVDLDALLEANGIAMDGDNIQITNIAPDEGLSASFNSWFTLFGQFFDHGLDLVAKGGSGTVYVPLQPDDPLYDPASPTNFMVLTRATTNPGPNGIWGDADDVTPINITTSFVDQNQTYTSHPSHQVFLREYTLVDGKPEATGRMLDGVNGGLPTWAEVKEQARTILGIDLTDYHVGNLPLLATDAYGNFIPNNDPLSASFGFPQVVMVGPPQTLASGTPASPLSLVIVGPDGPDTDTLPDITHLAVRTGHAFLDDIAHTAVPTGKLADGDIEVGLGNLDGSTTNGNYDNELLDSHFITGDGRGNENIGLTAVHHVFHAEHNRLLEHTMLVTLQTRDVAFINEWLDTDLTTAQVEAIPTDPAALATFAASLNWDGERLFQAAKFGTEMQYQHLVFEEFARKIQPAINTFLVPDGFDVTMNPSIVAEFAHVVYRFGHSMLTEDIARFDPAFADGSIGLIAGFLNPIEFASLTAPEMAGSIIRGMTRQVGNEIDEFVTSALRNNLLGLPLDLATINLARGRDTGVPSLNNARREFYAMTNENAFLKPYESWIDFAGNLKNEASIINFIAAYGTHELITSQATIEGKRDAALTIITGVSVGGHLVPADAVEFLNGQGIYASNLGGLDLIDLWIGGLAEKTMPFGGMLGSTFNFVFEGMMENLQSGDRFYYLQRLDGLHLFGEMENNSFAALIMRNTDATHLPSDVFSAPGLILEVDQTKQFNDLNGDGVLESDDPTGGGLLTQVVLRNNPATVGTDSNYLKYSGGEHVVLGGTAANDTLIAGIGDDTLYGDGGNDNLEGGFGNDIIVAGDGDDIIRDLGGDDNIKAGAGNDVVHAGGGLDLVMGGPGQDFIFLGTDEGSEVFAGEGNDFIYGNKNAERILGNEGDDWIETGAFDGAPGDNFDEIFARDEVNGHDVFLGDGGFDEFIAEGGDDIMVGSPGRGKMVGMSGWDWATYQNDVGPVNADLSRAVVFDENPTPPPNAALDSYEAVEGLSGSRFSDTLTGSNTLAEERVPFAPNGTGAEGYQGSRLTKEGIARITGLQQVLGLTNAQFAALAAGAIVYSEGDIILGGDGSDTIMGLAGDDIIDGDKYLEVAIGVFANGTDGSIGTGPLIATYKSMTELTTLMFNGTYNPGQLKIVREIKPDLTGGDIDVAKFQGNRSEYAFSATTDGQVIVSHAIEDSLDGTDRLRNIERAQFLDGNPLNIIVGTPGNVNQTINGTGTATTVQDDLILGLEGNDTLNGFGGNDILVGGPGNDILNGGLGDDTYSFSPGDGNDTINEPVTANVSGGAADRISILSPLDLNGVAVMQGLNAADNNAGTNNGSLVINFNSMTLTVANHYNTTTAGVGVERINFNSATFNGYLLGPDDYLVSRADPNNRDNDGVDLSASTANNFLVGENGTADDIFGGSGNDLIFGGTGDNNLFGNAGDDLLVGGSGNGDDDLLDGGLDADTMVGLNGNDTYIVDDLLDVVVEAAGANTGTDTVQTEMAALSIEFFANVENLEYTGLDADPFVGTGNAGNNVISGGDLADTLSGLAGNDRLEGGLGADIMTGGADNDIYEVDEAGDQVIEVAGGGTDTVESSISYTLAAELENLTLTGGDDLNGTGNSAANTIVGNDGVNQLFGGAGSDTLNGDGGNDLLDGGDGNDTLNGGDQNDTIIGGNGNDTIDVGGGVNTIVYNSTNFGADVINSFDSAGGTPANQDRIDLSGLGVTAANFANRVFESASGGNTIITVRENGPASTIQGTITINGSNTAAIDISDFTLAAAPPPVVGGATGGNNTINGTAAANTINGLGGNDTLNGLAGDDVINGSEGADTLNGGDGNDTLTGGTGSDVGTHVDNFGTAAYTNNNGTQNFAGNWIEGGGETGSATVGDIEIDGGRLQFNSNVDGGETIERAVNLAGATVASVSFTYEDDNLGAGQSVIVQARNVLTNAWETLTGGTLGSTTGNGAGTFNATLSANQIGANSAIRFLTVGDGNNWDNGDNFYVDNFTVSATVPGLNAGVDTVNGNAGDDTIVWNANATGATDGRDVVDGGAEGTAGDTFVINGNAAAEEYRIYTRAAWDALPGNAGGSLNAATEIVVTRGPNTDFATSVIAELREIEEIRINGVDPSAPGGAAGGDTFTLNGDFSGTSLRLNTVTIEGSGGDDTIDISSLASSHRVVFHTNGGIDTVIGTPRSQDVIVGTYTVEDGPVTPPVTPPAEPIKLVGDRKSNVLTGGDGSDALGGKGGNDTLTGGAGNDAMNGDGNDTFVLLDTRFLNDAMNGGDDNDTFVLLDTRFLFPCSSERFGPDFGNDTIKRGFDANAKGGQDMLEVSALGITAADFTTKVVREALGKDTLVTIGEDSILMVGGVDGKFTQADFLLA